MTEGAAASQNIILNSETSQDKGDTTQIEETNQDEPSSDSLPLEVRLERADQLLKA